MLNTAAEKRKWLEQRAKLKQTFSKLTETDLSFEGGKKDEMMAKVQARLGKTQTELLAIIAAL